MKGSTGSPGPNAPHLQYSHHLAAAITKPVKSQGWVEPKWRGQLPFPPGFILPLLGSAGLPKSIWIRGQEGQRAPKQGKGSGCREAEGATGDRRDTSLLLSCLAKLGWCAVLSDLTHDTNPYTNHTLRCCKGSVSISCKPAAWWNACLAHVRTR